MHNILVIFYDCNGLRTCDFFKNNSVDIATHVH